MKMIKSSRAHVGIDIGSIEAMLFLQLGANDTMYTMRYFYTYPSVLDRLLSLISSHFSLMIL